ncbi:hypothetical protein QS306_14000 [Paraburkholderia bonniea]|nr:hypothetical protein [Paraburkholderia bonniea]WJF91887.1 hypothetical protein QS306_14000 [Paraburkholderia bonniea]WJF95206.1 hypothetical protein QS308_14010 [Paraburkholderia bonniea]
MLDQTVSVSLPDMIRHAGNQQTEYRVPELNGDEVPWGDLCQVGDAGQTPDWTNRTNVIEVPQSFNTPQQCPNLPPQLGTGQLKQLAQAIVERRPDVVAGILKQGTPPIQNISPQDSLLHLALQYGCNSTFELLLDVPGMDLEQTDTKGRTLMQHSLQLGTLRRTKILIQRNASLSQLEAMHVISQRIDLCHETAQLHALCDSAIHDENTLPLREFLRTSQSLILAESLNFYLRNSIEPLNYAIAQEFMFHAIVHGLKELHDQIETRAHCSFFPEVYKRPGYTINLINEIVTPEIRSLRSHWLMKMDPEKNGQTQTPKSIPMSHPDNFVPSVHHYLPWSEPELGQRHEGTTPGSA